MKAIFLDIDGVLCLHGPPANLDATATHHLGAIVAATGASVVISSCWRASEHLLGVLLRHLHAYGVPVFGQTPVSGLWYALSRHPDYAGLSAATLLGMERAAEIRQWLGEHPEVDGWIAIDDTPLPIGPRLIWVERPHGLTHGHTLAAIKRLHHQHPADAACATEP